jgi:hypothetical protein
MAKRKQYIRVLSRIVLLAGGVAYFFVEYSLDCSSSKRVQRSGLEGEVTERLSIKVAIYSFVSTFLVPLAAWLHGIHVDPN